MRLTILILAFAVSAFAQDAEVIALNATDAAEIKSYYDQIDALNKKIAAKKAEIAEAYTKHEVVYPTFATACIYLNGEKPCTPPEPPKPTPEQEKAAHVREFIDGWQYGFKFSDDFKFIVPLPPPACNNVLCGTTLTGDTPSVTPFSNAVITQ